MKLGHSFRCALLAAAIYITIKLTVFFTHIQFSGIGIYSGILSLFLLAIPLYIGIKYKRDSDLGGYITLRQVMIEGIKISIVACLMIATYNFIHYKFIDTEVVAYWIEEAKRLGIKEKKSEQEVNEAITMLTEFYSPFKQATGVITGIIGSGVLFSFILSTFLVKRPPAEMN